MKHVLLSFCLAATISALPFARVSNLDGDDPMATALPPAFNGIPVTEIVSPFHRHEVHAVTVDMPEGASLSHASPESWSTLPMPEPPYEQSPAITVLQVAMN